MENVVNALPVALAEGATALSLFLTIICIFQVMFALRAKIRAHRIMTRDTALRSLAEQTSGINQKELDATIREVEAALVELSARDRKFVAEGLHQRNKISAKRYLEEVLTGT